MSEDKPNRLLHLLFKRHGWATRASLFAAAAGICATVLSAVLLEEANIQAGLRDLSRSVVWAAAMAILAALLLLRVKQALQISSEGASFLQEMRTDWFEAVSCCFAHSEAASESQTEDVKRFRHTLVRLVSLMHCAALAEVGGRRDITALVKLEPLNKEGLDDPTLRLVLLDGNTVNRVEMLLHMIQSLITKSECVRVPPPILAPVYQSLSKGFQSLLKAKKFAARALFPPPLAQLICILLTAVLCLTPITMSSAFKEPLIAGLAAFLPVLSVFAVHYVAVELEKPFGEAGCSLRVPLRRYQREMNVSLVTLVSARLTCHIAGTSDQCLFDVDQLMQRTLRQGDALGAEVGGNEQPLL